MQKTYSVRATGSLPGHRYSVFRAIFDAAAAFLLFALASSALMSGASSASPAPAAPHVQVSELTAPLAVKSLNDDAPRPVVAISTAAPREALFRQTSFDAAWILLATAFSLLAALNMALARHVRRAYALPRSRTQRTR